MSGTSKLLIKCFFMYGFLLVPSGDAFRAGRAQLISSTCRLEEMDLRLVLDRPGVAPAAAAGK
ncbi:MAG: hypothetical protein EA344_05280 [Alkalicoccus sp.]|nr:MAG: hypothetical protein EA344_05280 [Alkalicoccus sp.]